MLVQNSNLLLIILLLINVLLFNIWNQSKQKIKKKGEKRAKTDEIYRQTVGKKHPYLFSQCQAVSILIVKEREKEWETKIV